MMRTRRARIGETLRASITLGSISTLIAEGILSCFGAALSAPLAALLLVLLVGLFTAAEIRFTPNPQSQSIMARPKLSTRASLAIPAGFPASLAVGLDRVAGQSVIGARSGKPVAIVDHVCLNDLGPGRSTLEVVLREATAELKVEDLALEVAVADPLEDPDLPRKWKVGRIQQA